MGIKFNKDKNLEERLNFVRPYVEWIKSADNEDWTLASTTYLKFQNKNLKNY